MTQTPTRSLSQRMTALEKANTIRSHRAQMKRDIKAGRIRVVEILTSPAPEVMTMKVWDLLIAIPKVGRTKANKILTRSRTSPSKTIAGLSDRQRDEILDGLGGRSA